MISETNQIDIAAAGLTYILGARIPFGYGRQSRGRIVHKTAPQSQISRRLQSRPFAPLAGPR
jgi:hypothetical protein